MSPYGGLRRQGGIAALPRIGNWKLEFSILKFVPWCHYRSKFWNIVMHDITCKRICALLEKKISTSVVDCQAWRVLY